MSHISRLFIQKAFFTFLIIVSLSSALLAMEEEHELNGEEMGKTSVHPNLTESSPDVFQSNPPSTLLGKTTHWLWNKGGTYIDYGIIGATTYGGAYVGSLYDDVVGRYAAESVGTRPTSLSYHREQISLLANERILHNTRINTLQNGTPHYGFPYDDLGTGSGATLGYFTGMGITKIRHWTVDKLIQSYRPVKNWFLDNLFSLGWKIADRAKNFKED
ncbi:MAG TPA: hypothetical protein VMW10_05025 [Alphaproteobacteria bacterium]|nr:hypothetical protein [Alphaproteobacteria bacterium]